MKLRFYQPDRHSKSSSTEKFNQAWIDCAKLDVPEVEHTFRDFEQNPGKLQFEDIVAGGMEVVAFIVATALFCSLIYFIGRILILVYSQKL
jgi:hypothetical protein